TIHTVGIPESNLAKRIESIENNLPSTIRLAYLPNLGGVRLRLSLRCEPAQKEPLLLQLHSLVEQLYEILGDSIFGEETTTLEQTLVHLLERNRMTIAFAESCTGGACTARLVQVSGASSVLEGSIVCYSNRIKEQELGVSAQTLASEGAVSQATAEQMAIGIRNKMNASIGVAITGIAGPEGGTPEKPVGTVWIAVATQSDVQAMRFQFEKDRQRNIERTVWAALDFARRKILQLTR
ncbi:MAG: nicotinamide-nucleotide amidohydrolase family protein, partial [Bacteroidia bacterium]|nr:nicotinamide-nucleotide amidohydrolase family protein [Bacteroidia bacterium]